MSTNHPAHQNPPPPVSVYWLPQVSTDGQDVDCWITFPGKGRSFWSFPKNRLIDCSWSESGSVAIEFLTHTFQLKAVSAEDLAAKILSGRTSLIEADSPYQTDWFTQFPLGNRENVLTVTACEKDPAYELLPKNS